MAKREKRWNEEEMADDSHLPLHEYSKKQREKQREEKIKQERRRKIDQRVSAYAMYDGHFNENMG